MTYLEDEIYELDNLVTALRRASDVRCTERSVKIMLQYCDMIDETSREIRTELEKCLEDK